MYAGDEVYGDDVTSGLLPEPEAPEGEPGECRSCHAPVLWRLTAKGKRAPFDQDGTSHFATCPDATRWRKR